MVKLPEYVYRETLPSGRVRYRFEKRGKKKVTLKGEPGSPEFLRQYADCLDDVYHTKETAKARIVKGSISWLVGRYMEDLETRVGAGLSSPLTLKQRKWLLTLLVERHGVKDMRMPRGKLTEFLDEFAETPGKRDNLRKAISALYGWAIDREYVSDNPAKDIKKINKKSEGFYTCTIDDIRGYLAHHGPGTTARRVMVLELCTGARREDLRTLGTFNEVNTDGQRWLRWRQSKKPFKWVEIPMLPMLIDELKDHNDGCYILNKHGKPYTHGSLGTMVRRWFDAAEVRGSLHPVRKGLASILPEYGASSFEIDVLLGHELNSSESKVYTEKAKRAAIAAILSERMQKIAF